MIGRKTARAIAEAYHHMFKGAARRSIGAAGGGPEGSQAFYTHRYRLKKGELHDFLFENDYEDFILNDIEALAVDDPRSLRQYFMRLHLGTPIIDMWLKENAIMLEVTKRDEEEARASGNKILERLAGDAIAWASSTGSPLDGPGRGAFERLLSHIELDGYVFRDGVLYLAEASIIDVASEVGLLQRLVVGVGLENAPVIDHHLSQAEKDYLDRSWGNCISNSRKFLEAVLREVAARHHLLRSDAVMDRGIYQKPVEVRRYLENEGLVDKAEREVIEKVYGLLSATGSHPHIAENSQARLMRYLALCLAQYMLLKLEAHQGK